MLATSFACRGLARYFTDRRCAVCGIYPRTEMLLRLSSRLIVDGARPISDAIARIDNPARRKVLQLFTFEQAEVTGMDDLLDDIEERRFRRSRGFFAAAHRHCSLPGNAPPGRRDRRALG